MKKIYALAIGLIATFSFAQTTTFNYTGVVETYTVPAGVTSISIQAIGAEGGLVLNTSTPGIPGKGADMKGTFAVTPGQVLNIMVGEQAPTSDRSSGGGGGSFVWDDASSTLLIAAGGGGGACAYSGTCDGADAVVTENATNGLTQPDGGGVAGDGGTLPTSGDGWGGGGAGWNSNGVAGSLHGCTFTCTGGNTPLSGGAGGSRGGTDFTGSDLNTRGGFGGGGGGNGKCGVVGAGGGGGYSGGGSGAEYPGVSAYNGGGGGGSYNAGTDQVNIGGSNTGHGQVIINVECTALTTSVSDDTLCAGEEVTLSASGAGTVTWDMGVVDGVAFTPPVGVTTYTATSSDPSECAFSVDILVGEIPTVDAGADIQVCDGDSVTLSGSGTATSYAWDGGISDGVIFAPPAGITTYTLTGTVDSTGCFNTDMVDVQNIVLIASTSFSGGVLTASPAGDSYQWIDCSDGSAIAGATSSTYTPQPGDGSYAVVITSGPCTDTSDCTEFFAGLENGNSIIISVYPNPTDGQFNLHVNDNFHYQIFNALGEVILSGKGTDLEIIDLSDYPAGTYMINVTKDNKNKSLQLIKQ